MAKETKQTKQDPKTQDTEARMTEITKDMETKSAQIRALDAEGYTRSQIAKFLSKKYGKEVRYQHVRNVLVTKVQNPRTS